MRGRALPAGRPVRGAAVAVVAFVALAAAACRSESSTAARQERGRTARLDLQPRKSSFRDIGKRADSDLAVP